jgi:hypothetical protein
VQAIYTSCTCRQNFVDRALRFVDESRYTEMSGRGPGFPPLEDLALARAWVHTSEKTEEKYSAAFWSEVYETFENQPEAASRERGPGSLSARWVQLQRTVQRYLAADKQYRAHTPSGETEDSTREAVMTLYQKQNKTKTTNGERDPPPLKSLDAVSVLKACPKFSEKVGGSSKTCSGYRTAQRSTNGIQISSEITTGKSNAIFDQSEPYSDPIAVTPNASGTIPAANSSASRDAGVKKMRKKEISRKRGSNAAVADVATAIREAAKSKEKVNRAALRLSIIRMLPESEKKHELLVQLLEAVGVDGDIVAGLENSGVGRAQDGDEEYNAGASHSS